jgi:hypothetical protein
LFLLFQAVGTALPVNGCFPANWDVRATVWSWPIAATALLRQPHVIEKRCNVLATALVASDIWGACNEMIDKGI